MTCPCLPADNNQNITVPTVESCPVFSVSTADCGGSNLSVLDKNGTVVDPAVISIKADPNGLQTWTELSAGNVQLIVNVASNITINNNFSWTFNNSYWTIGGSGGIIYNIPLEICGYQFWCCTTFPLSAANYNNLALPAVGTPDQGATVYDISTSNGAGTSITGIVPATFNGVTGPQLIALHNIGLNPITLVDLGASAATNQFFMPPLWTGNLILQQDDSAVLWQDGCDGGGWVLLGTTVGLTTKNIDNTQALNGNTATIIANNDLGTAANGRIHLTKNLTTTQLDWQGLRGFSTAGGYVGPEPDIDFEGVACAGGSGASILATVTDDSANKRIKVALNTTGITGTTSSPIVTSVTFNSTTCQLTVVTKTLSITYNCGLITAISIA